MPGVWEGNCMTLEIKRKRGRPKKTDALKNADELVEKAITEYLQERAWIENEPEEKHGSEQTHIKFSPAINKAAIVLFTEIVVLLLVTILYLGARI